MIVETKKLPKSQIELTVKVGVRDVKEMYEHVLNEAVEVTEIEGFRKGKAPKEKVEQKLGVSRLYGDVIDHLLQKYYIQAIKENHITPIANPKVEIKEFDLEKDFEFVAIVAIKPDVKVGDYKADLKKYYKEKSQTIRKENEEKIKKGEQVETTHVHLTPAEIIDVISKNATIDVPELIIEDETTRMMARLVDQAQALGISLEDYLKAQNITQEKLKADYQKIAEQNLTAEFVLSYLVEQEKVAVDDKEVDETIKASGIDEAELVQDPLQKAYIRMILQKNKFINNLIMEIEEENK